MAKQRGIFKMLGTLDDVTFYKSQDGYVAKVKTTLTKEQIASNPNFARMRENGRDFGRAGTAGKVLRRAFQSILLGTDSRMVSRLQRVLLQGMSLDTTNVRGEKTITAGDPLVLKDFEFNIAGALASTLKATVSVTLNRATGTASIVVPSLVPSISIGAPAGATHYKLIGGAAAIDFDTHVSTGDTKESAYLPIDNSTAAAVTLSLALPANTTLPVLQVLGSRFFLEDNGTKYALNNGAYNAMSIVDVDV